MIEYLIYSSIALPLFSVFLIVLLKDKPDLRDCVSIITSFLLFFIVLHIYLSFDTNNTVEYVVLHIINDISISFHIEPLGMLFSLIASVLWIATNIYAIGYMRLNKEKNQTRFYSFFALSISATMAIAFSANMLTLFLFYELLTLLTYPLVTHSGNQQARQNGRVYLGVLLLSSIGLQLTAIILIWLITNNLNFQPSGVFQNARSELVIIIYLLFIFGVGKAALMPFHRWLPAAMVAPTPVSALLHAVAVVKAGVFTILKASVYLFGLDTLQNFEASHFLYLIPGFTIVVASLIALQQDNLKKRLAYSTISQLSYVVLATIILTPLSAMAAGLHILAHAFGKITLFFAAGSIYTMTNKTNISDMQGIGISMPITMTAFFIGSLSMIGVPPTIGFISKWFILDSALSAQYFAVVAIIILSTLLNAAYYLPVCYQAFFKKTVGADLIHTKESPPAIVLPIIFTMLMTLFLFVYPDAALQLLQEIFTDYE